MFATLIPGAARTMTPEFMSFLKQSSATIPYFALTDSPLEDDLAPTRPLWTFGAVRAHSRPAYIRQRNFTFACLRSEQNGSVLMATFGALCFPKGNGMMLHAQEWLLINIGVIGKKWEEVLDFIERQTALPVTSRP